MNQKKVIANAVDAKIPRYVSYLNDSNHDVFQVDGVFWICNDGIVSPAYLPHIQPIISRSCAKKALKISGGLFVRWASNFDSQIQQGWWFVIRNDNYSPQLFSSKMRNQINKGRRKFTVKKISSAELLKQGYSVCKKAVSRYKKGTIFLPTPKLFEEKVKTANKYSDVVDYIGVFSADILVAFSVNYKQEKGVFLESIWHDPDYLKDYSSYVLIDFILNYYLNETGMFYVSDGSRSLYHDTNVQQFLIEKFGFRRAYANLNLEYSLRIMIFLKVLFIFRKLMKILSIKSNLQFFRKIHGLILQEEINKNQTRN